MMKNNSKETEQLRLSLLRFLDASAEATSRGMAESLLWQMARNEGRTGLTLEEVRAELMYLKDRNLICEVPKPISPELRSWRITADGRDQHAQLTT
jgi:hypothetical protein